jgi:hypothetical protein
MTKRICRLTIFLALVGGIAGLCFIHVPATCWWNHDEIAWMLSAPLIIWLLFNIAIPFAIVGVGSLLVVGLWCLAGYLCASLRRTVAGWRGK